MSEFGPVSGGTLCAPCAKENRIRVAGWWTLGGVPLCDGCAGESAPTEEEGPDGPPPP